MEPDNQHNGTASGRQGAATPSGGRHAAHARVPEAIPSQPTQAAPRQATPQPQQAPHATQQSQQPYGQQQPYAAQPPVQNAGPYSHSAYAPGEVIRVRKKRKKHRTLKRVLLIILIVLVLAIGGAIAYAAHYVNKLSENMAMDTNTMSELKDVMAAAPAQPEQQAFYMLLVGSDNWETYGERSDALVLVRIDPTNNQVTLVSVPRDTPYMLNGNKVKLNQAFAEGGAPAAVEAVQSVTGVPISYYAEIEFSGLAEFVDSMGGIYVDVPTAFDYQVYTGDRPVVHVDEGLQHLDGEQCVALARMRTVYGVDQDANRQSNIRAMTVALLNSVLQSPPAEIPGLVERLSSCVSSSMDIQTMIGLASGFTQGGSPKIYTCTGPYDGDIDPETGLWLCYEDPQGWADLMKVVDEGGNPEAVHTTVQGK